MRSPRESRFSRPRLQLWLQLPASPWKPRRSKRLPNRGPSQPFHLLPKNLFIYYQEKGNGATFAKPANVGWSVNLGRTGKGLSPGGRAHHQMRCCYALPFSFPFRGIYIPPGKEGKMEEGFFHVEGSRNENWKTRPENLSYKACHSPSLRATSPQLVRLVGLCPGSHQIAYSTPW